MDDTVLLKVLDSKRELQNNLTSSIFMQLELPLPEVIEQIFAFHVLKDDVVVRGVLEHVDQANDVRVLAGLQHIDLSQLLDYFNWFHRFLLDYLHCNAFTTLIFSAGLNDLSKLSTAEDCTLIVVVFKLSVSN